MTKSIKQQYIDLQEGKMTQSNFMRNVRMTLPHLVNNVTSYKDTVRILKNKGILTESINNSEITNFSMKNGSEGPSHDPYGYSEYSFTKDGKKYVIHLGLAQFIKIDNEKIQAHGDEYDNPELFVKKYTGMDLSSLEPLIDKWENDHNYDDDPMGPPSRYMESLSEGKTKLQAYDANPTELRMGIKIEMEHTDDPKKAEKIALDHLSENPFYYTQLHLAGLDAEHFEKKPKKRTDIGEEVTTKNLVDKANGMKPVKGMENAKASANKATKETVKGEPVKLMSLIAQTVRGIQRMNATGEKMKKIKLKETENDEYYDIDDEGFQDFIKQKKEEETLSQEYDGIKRGDIVRVKDEAADALALDPTIEYTIHGFIPYGKGITKSVDAVLSKDYKIKVNTKYLTKI